MLFAYLLRAGFMPMFVYWFDYLWYNFMTCIINMPTFIMCIRRMVMMMMMMMMKLYGAFEYIS